MPSRSSSQPASLSSERHALDDGARLGDALEERRVDRRRDDDAIARCGDLAEQLDDAHHDVARGADPRRVDRPAEAALRERRVRVADAGVGRRVAGVAELRRRG